MRFYRWQSRKSIDSQTAKNPDESLTTEAEEREIRYLCALALCIIFTSVSVDADSWIPIAGDSEKTSVVAFTMVERFVVGISGISLSEAMLRLVRREERIEPVDSRGWLAWVKLQPPDRSLHIHGIGEAPTPGYQAELQVARPQGINPQELILDLQLSPLGGEWPEVATPIPVIYEDITYQGDHETVLIRFPSGTVLQLEIRKVH